MRAIGFSINKNINKPIEFKGLKAQYIWWVGLGLVALLILFAAMYFIGINSFVCLGITGMAGLFLFFKVSTISRRYGEHGMMKAVARKRVPRVIKSYSRKVFRDLKTCLN